MFGMSQSGFKGSPESPVMDSKRKKIKKIRGSLSKKLGSGALVSKAVELDIRSNGGDRGSTSDAKSVNSAPGYFGRFKTSRRPSTERKVPPIDGSDNRRSSLVSTRRRPSLNGFTTAIGRGSLERSPSADSAPPSRYGSSEASVGSRGSPRRLSASSTGSGGRPSTSSSLEWFPPPPLVSSSSYGVVPAPSKPHPIVEALLEAMTKEHLLDVDLIAADGSRIKTARFVMASRVGSLERKLYPDEGDPPSEISLGPYSKVVLEALVEYCFTGEIMRSTLYTEETPSSVRCLVELAELAGSLAFRVLVDDVYQWARRIMNRNPNLACAIYDCAQTSCVREFESYALQTIEDVPKQALLRGNCGIKYLSSVRLEKLFTDNEIEVDELTHFCMLVRWHEENGKSDESLRVARKLAKKIELQFIEVSDLLSTVKKSGLVDDEDIEKARLDQSVLSATISLHGHKSDLERVLVEGAGIERVNGMYYRQPDRDGQAMYSKGVGQDSIDLVQWESTWSIGPSFDLSNIYYKCDVDGCIDMVPMHGWEVSLQGEKPPPSCTWIAATSLQDESEGQRSVPACFRSEEELYGN